MSCPKGTSRGLEVLQKQHVAIQLTKGGGPEPLMELRRLYEAAHMTEGACWIATRKPGVAFVQDADSRMLAFAHNNGGMVSVLTARIDGRTTEFPDDPVAHDLYGDFRQQFEAFWHLRDVRLTSMPMEELPGKTLASGMPLSRAFERGALSFAYWLPPPCDLDGSPPVAEGPMLEGESLAALEEQRGLAVPTPPIADSHDDYLSAASAAQLLGVTQSTIAGRVAKDEVIGFRSSNGTLCIPREQFANGDVIEGVPDVLAMFTEEWPDGLCRVNHRGAWSFLCTSLYPGDTAPRPLDRLKADTHTNARAVVVSELARAKESLDYGDHI